MEYFLPGHTITNVHGQPKRIKVNFGEQQAPGGRHGVNGMQGGSEQRTESYQKYDEGVAELTTQQPVTSNSEASASGTGQGIASVVVLPLYHPAAALYNGGLRQTLFDDFTAVPVIIKQIELEK